MLLTNRTSLDQTTLNQSVSVNGVHSDNDTSQVAEKGTAFLWSADVCLAAPPSRIRLLWLIRKRGETAQLKMKLGRNFEANDREIVQR